MKSLEIKMSEHQKLGMFLCCSMTISQDMNWEYFY